MNVPEREIIANMTGTDGGKKYGLTRPFLRHWARNHAMNAIVGKKILPNKWSRLSRMAENCAFRFMAGFMPMFQ